MKKCSEDCNIGFGAIFSKPDSIVEPGVYVGNYALLGSVHLGAGCLIGSRASILSGGSAHLQDNQGSWTAFDKRFVTTTCIGRNTWVGEAALVAANVGEHAMVSAGAVVGSPVPDGIMVAGNPARFVRKLDFQPQMALAEVADVSQTHAQS